MTDPIRNASELAALLEKATLGPWVTYERQPRSDCWRITDRDDIVADLFMLREEDHSYLPYDRAEANAALIVWLVNNAPAIIAAQAARLRSMEEALKPFAEELGRFGIGNSSAHVELRLSGRKAIANLDLSVADFERARAALSGEGQ